MLFATAEWVIGLSLMIGRGLRVTRYLLVLWALGILPPPPHPRTFDEPSDHRGEPETPGSGSTAGRDRAFPGRASYP